MRALRTGFVVAGIGVAVSFLVATSQAGASRAVIEEAPVPASASLSTPASDSDDDDDALSLASSGGHEDQGRTDQSDTHCAGSKKACGINGRYVCCDFETECCRRKPHKTYCAPKDNKPCFKNHDSGAPVPVPVPSPN